jgi:hypothetical protein
MRRCASSAFRRAGSRRAEIEAAYLAQPPDDTMIVSAVERLGPDAS